jgi:Gliding motility associated protein GldN
LRPDIISEGNYRGSQSIYWVKWADFVKVCGLYKGGEILKMAGDAIWDDYFMDSAVEKPGYRPGLTAIGNNGWSRTALRNTRILIPEDDGTHNLREIMDTSITELLYNRALSGSLYAGKDDGHGHWGTLTKEELKQIISSPKDTVMMQDPVSGEVVMKIIVHDFCFECVNKYTVEEYWVQDQKKGTTEIEYRWVAPVKDSVVDGIYLGSKRLFWVHYDDAKAALAGFNASHPRNNLEWQLWADRFREPKHQKDGKR